MIYFKDLNSIIESIYLEDSISESISNCTIFVNPDNVTYLANRVIIITESDYPNENIDVLLKNNCEVISRIKLTRYDVNFQPYLLRLYLNINWNGDDVFVETIDDVIDSCNYDIERNKLLFPKITIKPTSKLTFLDKEGNLTSLGWASQQVGINIKNSSQTNFTNLDIVKTKKSLR